MSKDKKEEIKVNTDVNFLIPKDLRDGLVEYLGNQPCKAVHNGWIALQNLKEANYNTLLVLQLKLDFCIEALESQRTDLIGDFLHEELERIEKEAE